jgi:hypothetical protein
LNVSSTESRLALSAMRIASFLFLRLSAKICVLLNIMIRFMNPFCQWKSARCCYGFRIVPGGSRTSR